MMTDSGKVYLHERRAGRVWRDENGYHFRYDPAYLSGGGPPISLTMPLRTEPYSEPTTLHPFFDNLIPEGWLLDVAVDNWKLDPRDRFRLLLTVCRECIGAVSIEAENLTDDE